MKLLRQIMPGLLLSFTVASIAKILSKFIPTLGAASLAILLGILLGQTIGKQKIFSKGTRFSEGMLLEISIALLGTTLSFHTLSQVGMRGIIFVLSQMILTIILAIYIGKKLKLPPEIYLLMASGNAVCGSSAVAATAPAIHADETSKGLVITIVNLMGTCLMFILPAATFFLYNHEPLQTAPLIGGTLQSVAQVVASGSMINQDILDGALIFKIIRIIFLVGVVFILGQLVPKENSQKLTHSKKITAFLPWYIIAFFMGCLLQSAQIIPSSLLSQFKAISGWFELMALSAIGLRLNIRSLFDGGSTFLLYGFSLGTLQVLVAIVLIALIF